MGTTVINIEGMHCQHCVASVHDALVAIDGVDKVEVDLEAGNATVSYDAGLAELEDMREAIFDQGFDVVG